MPDLRALLSRVADEPDAGPDTDAILARADGLARRRRVAITLALLVTLPVAAIAVWDAATRRDVQFLDSAPATTLPVPALGDVTPEMLADGTPVFVVHHRDGAVSVLDAASPHRPLVAEKLVAWCAPARAFLDVQHDSRFDERGLYRFGPSPKSLRSYEVERAGDTVRVLGPGTVPSREDARRRPGPGIDFDRCFDDRQQTRLDYERLVAHRPSAAAWPRRTAEQLTDGWTVVGAATLVLGEDGSGWLCTDLERPTPPRCPAGSPPVSAAHAYDEAPSRRLADVLVHATGGVVTRILEFAPLSVAQEWGVALSVLDRPLTDRDGLPPEVARDGAGQSLRDPADARLALERDGARYYVGLGGLATGPMDDRLCLLEVERPEWVAGTCGSLADVGRHGVLLATGGPAGSRLAGVVPDGYIHARVGEQQTEVVDNVFAFATRQPLAGPIEVTGPAGTLILRGSDWPQTDPAAPQQAALDAPCPPTGSEPDPRAVPSASPDGDVVVEITDRPEGFEPVTEFIEGKGFAVEYAPPPQWAQQVRSGVEGVIAAGDWATTERYIVVTAVQGPNEALCATLRQAAHDRSQAVALRGTAAILDSGLLLWIERDGLMIQLLTGAADVSGEELLRVAEGLAVSG